MLTTKQAATRLGITPRRVGALIAAGRLPATKLGRDWLIAEESLAMVAERKPGNHSGRPRVKSR
jgi:excisionase family DNA binding protein